MADDEPVTIKFSDAKRPPTIVSVKARVEKCKHFAIEVSENLPKAWCGTCGEEIDPYDALRITARNECKATEQYNLTVTRHEHYLKLRREHLEDKQKRCRHKRWMSFLDKDGEIDKDHKKCVRCEKLLNADGSPCVELPDEPDGEDRRLNNGN